jgi:hypothetical protein
VKVGTYRMVESFGVWSAPHAATGWRFRAVYSHTYRAKAGWSWDTALWRPPVLRRFLDATITDLGEWLPVFGDVGKPWYKAITARVSDQQDRQRAAARARGRQTKEGSS